MMSWDELQMAKRLLTLDEKTGDISLRPARSKGERMLRAAAQGASHQEIAEIEAEEDITITTRELYDWTQQQLRQDRSPKIDIDRAGVEHSTDGIYTFVGQRFTGFEEDK
jgi:hypothetical protein